MRFAAISSLTLALLLALWAPPNFSLAQDRRQDEDAEKTTQDATQTDETDATENEEEEEVTLERFFPEKSVFGPRAYGMDFSHDGRYGAYLYRPYIERRHGSDLWLYDTKRGETTRLTSVMIMSEFQKETREVRDDRVKKAKKTRKKDAGKDEKPADQSGAATATDPIIGVWEGTVSEGEEIDLDPEGVMFVMAITRGGDGAYTGSIASQEGVAAITGGSFDAETGALELSLLIIEPGLKATLEATIMEGSLEGTITIPEINAELSIQATKKSVESSDDDEQTNEEEIKDDGSEREEESDAEESDDEIDENEDADDEEEKEKEDEKLGDIVDEDDADAEKAPRYDGIQSFEWAPASNELIFVSQGDLYRYEVESGEITRLTITQERERDVQYLPDGSGYTYMRDDGLIKVKFGDHLIEQLDPKLPSGESMSGYRISPDGKRLVLLTGKGRSYWGEGREVNIVNYRDRFAQVRTVRRHMPDDPLPDYEWSVYLYEIGDHVEEEGQLARVHTHKQSGPRDIMRVPEWAPDSSRVAFATFEQTSGMVQILEAQFPEPEEDEADEDKADEEGDADAESDENGEEDDGDVEEDEENGGDDDGDDEEEEQERTDAEQADEDEEEVHEMVFEDAQVVYQFYHNGGPNTPGMIEPEYLADSRRLVFITEQSGFRQLHVLDPLYESLSQLTRGQFEIYPIDISDDHTRMWVESTKAHPSERHVYEVDLESGEMRRLTHEQGTYSSAAVSEDGRHVLASFIDFGSPRELVAIDAETPEGDEPMTILTDSHPEEAHKITQWAPEFFTYENRHGHTIYGHMFKPDDYSPEDKRPLLIYVYGGPLGTGKMVDRGSFSGSSYYFAYYMANKHGYVTCTIDPRGASGYGGLFEKSNFEQVGKPQVEDLVDGAKWFIENHGVDPERVGIHGWSFGGFQTQMCLYTEPDVFAAGIAGAGPTEWYNYNSWYTTGTVGDREGLSEKDKEKDPHYSLLPLAKNLKAHLLLIHGMEDSNVLYQDTVRIYRELLKAGKETLVELFLDPTGGHGLGGDVKALGRYRKYEDFLLQYLGEGTPVEAKDEAGDEGDDGSTEELAEEDKSAT